MTMTDPIADLLTRIRNACGAGHSTLMVPRSKLKLGRFGDRGLAGRSWRRQRTRCHQGFLGGSGGFGRIVSHS